METLRLRKMQQPSRVERLLEAFIMRANLLPEGAYQIRDPGALPAELRELVNHAITQGQAWSCWAHRVDTWLFTCDMSLPLSRERGTPVLQVSVHDGDGRLQDSGTWMTNPQGTWYRCPD
jgi:hypothetical protein